MYKTTGPFKETAVGPRTLFVDENNMENTLLVDRVTLLQSSLNLSSTSEIERNILLSAAEEVTDNVTETENF